MNSRYCRVLHDRIEGERSPDVLTSLIRRVDEHSSCTLSYRHVPYEPDRSLTIKVRPRDYSILKIVAEPNTHVTQVTMPPYPDQVAARRFHRLHRLRDARRTGPCKTHRLRSARSTMPRPLPLSDGETSGPPRTRTAVLDPCGSRRQGGPPACLWFGDGSSSLKRSVAVSGDVVGSPLRCRMTPVADTSTPHVRSVTLAVETPSDSHYFAGKPSRSNRSVSLPRRRMVALPRRRDSPTASVDVSPENG